MLKLLRVKGHSMIPTAQEGDFVLIHTIFHKAGLNSGDWLVFDHPDFGLLLKECVTKDFKNNTFRFKSVNPSGLTEKKMGNIPYSSIMGKVCWHIPCQLI